MRFLGRPVYLGAVVVLVTAMFHGLTAGRARRNREVFGIGERTLARWRQWWREAFTGSAFWKSARARFSPPVDDATLPLSMVVRLGGAESVDALIGTLRFISPITTSSPSKEAGSTMGV